MRRFAEQALSRAAGAGLISGNRVELLIDARANYAAWLEAIRGAQHCILFENYIYSDDAIGREFRDALAERASAGIKVFVLRDWVGCLRESNAAFWKPLLDAGGEVRVFNPPSVASPFAWLSRDHRKSIVVDGAIGFVSGMCVSSKWLGNPEKGIPPWRDTGVAIHGPAIAELVRAFADVWQQIGTPLPDAIVTCVHAQSASGDIDLRVVATMPNTVGLYRLDQLIAAIAQKSLWLTDAYFVGTNAYVQALTAAARDGVDVRLLVPGSSDVPAVASLSRAGYRVLLEAGVRVFEWNGSMLHAKTAVADRRWARVGSTNLNIASWMGNCELDVAIENIAFAQQMEKQYLADLGNATEIVLNERQRIRCSAVPPANPKRIGGSASRATASAIRLANTVGATFKRRRDLGAAEAGIVLGSALALLVTALIGLLWPRLLAWPLALFALWIGLAELYRYSRLKRRGSSSTAGPESTAQPNPSPMDQHRVDRDP
ncbi:MAG: phospholipase D-like domain-containing protein [Dokdonella sp.]